MRFSISLFGLINSDSSTGTIYTGVKQPGRESIHFHLAPKIRNVRSYTSTFNLHIEI